MILFFSVPLITSIIVASVVLFPLPVVPVSSVSPRSAKAISLTMCGRFNSSIVGIVIGMTRTTIADVAECPKCTAAKTGQTGQNIREIQADRDRSVERICDDFRRQHAHDFSRFCAVSGGLSTMRSSLASRNIGGAPGCKCKSEAPCCTANSSNFSISIAASYHAQVQVSTQCIEPLLQAEQLAEATICRSTLSPVRLRREPASHTTRAIRLPPFCRRRRRCECPRDGRGREFGPAIPTM